MKFTTFSDSLSTALILLVTSLLLSISGGFQRAENILYDLGQQVYSNSIPTDIVIVAVDEESLSEIGRWPWSRHLHAALINILKKERARVIALDIIFAEPDMANPSADLALSDAIQQAGNIVLPVLMENNRVNGPVIETLPLPMFSEYAKTMGHVHVELDEDGIARSVYLWEGLGTPAWPLFAQAVLRSANIVLQPKYLTPPEQPQTNVNPFLIAKQGHRGVSFLGKPGSIQSISYAQVLKGEFSPDLFKNKIVLVGATASGIGDSLPTPVSGLHQPMSGVEFHANVIESIRRDRLISQTPQWLTTCICALLATLPILWLPRLTPALGMLTTSLWLLAVAGIGMLLPSLFGIWLPLSSALFTIAISYPIWSLQKLNAAQHFLDEKLQMLHKDADWVEASIDENETVNPKKTKDRLQMRISQVQAASKRLRKLHEDRLEILAFISHDLRTPLSSALMHIDPSAEHLKNPLTHALQLAEDFLHASRAEMMDLSHFKELDLTAIMYQVINDAYPVALQKQIKLIHESMSEPVWVLGDFGLLHRAVLNLVLNAIKFSPLHATVTLALHVAAQCAIISVTDHGPGISHDQQKRLFQRFSRSESDVSMSQSTGLGLYFVRTVVVKHGGNVEVSSELNFFTTFTMRLPLAPDSKPK